MVLAPQTEPSYTLYSQNKTFWLNFYFYLIGFSPSGYPTQQVSRVGTLFLLLCVLSYSGQGRGGNERKDVEDWSSQGSLIHSFVVMTICLHTHTWEKIHSFSYSQSGFNPNPPYAQVGEQLLTLCSRFVFHFSSWSSHLTAAIARSLCRVDGDHVCPWTSTRTLQMLCRSLWLLFTPVVVDALLSNIIIAISSLKASLCLLAVLLGSHIELWQWTVVIPTEAACHHYLPSLGTCGSIHCTAPGKPAPPPYVLLSLGNCFLLRSTELELRPCLSPQTSVGLCCHLRLGCDIMTESELGKSFFPQSLLSLHCNFIYNSIRYCQVDSLGPGFSLTRPICQPLI